MVGSVEIGPGLVAPTVVGFLGVKRVDRVVDTLLDEDFMVLGIIGTGLEVVGVVVLSVDDPDTNIFKINHFCKLSTV